MPKTKNTSRPSEVYCDPCGGSGQVFTKNATSFVLKKCTKCDGSGNVLRPDRPKKTKLLSNCA